MFIINTFKKFIICFRNVIKYISLTIISVFLAIVSIAIFYKPTYEVYLNGKVVGYTENKSELQMKINQYMEGKTEKGVAFVQIDSVPEYKLCLLKKDVDLNDDEIYEKTIKDGTKYYKYYAITDSKKEKAYVETFKEAEEVIEKLKKKNSANKKTIGIIEKYETSKKEFTNVEKCVSKIYKKSTPKVQTKNFVSSGYVEGLSFARVDIGINLIKPVSGVITSRFGSRAGRSRAHRGLDIGAPTGRSIKAAASGTVTVSGWNGSYGNMIKISHGKGVETVYGHCSQLLVSVGQKVTQGQVIGKVGSTGNSTGPHLHLEVRKNGTLYNPQNYVY